MDVSVRTMDMARDKAEGFPIFPIIGSIWVRCWVRLVDADARRRGGPLRGQTLEVALVSYAWKGAG